MHGPLFQSEFRRSLLIKTYFAGLKSPIDKLLATYWVRRHQFQTYHTALSSSLEDS